jgi:hypothetical protein
MNTHSSLKRHHHSFEEIPDRLSFRRQPTVSPAAEACP